MAINTKSLINATRGTVFYAPAETPLPADGVAGFGINVAVVGDWNNMGHTSNDNRLQFSADGGDATTLSTWLDPNARTTYADVTLTVTGASVQADVDSLKMIYNAWEGEHGGLVSTNQKREQKLALFILAYDAGQNVKFGIYLPNVSFAYDASNMIAFSDSGFTEFGFTANTQTSTTLTAGPNGELGTFELFPASAFGTDMTVAVTGVSLTPTTAEVEVDGDVELTYQITPPDATNQNVTVASSSDANATAVKADGENKITVHGVKAGAANITVTTEDGDKSATTAVTVNPKA